MLALTSPGIESGSRAGPSGAIGILRSVWVRGLTILWDSRGRPLLAVGLTQNRLANRSGKTGLKVAIRRTKPRPGDTAVVTFLPQLDAEVKQVRPQVNS